MTTVRTETETVIKRVLPYLYRKGYELEDLDFETAVKKERYKNGYVDVLVTNSRRKPAFLIEAKRISKALTDKDRDQAIAYGIALKLQFVVVTNGIEVRCFNVANSQPILWDGARGNKVPSKDQLAKVLTQLKANKELTSISLGKDQSIPFRPGLPLKQLNALFQRCHNTIRKIEKDEEHAFSDFSKFLFLKLLEEKADTEEGFAVPYSFQFHELAEHSETEADRVKTTVESMLNDVRNRTPYGDVINSPLYLKNAKTFQYLVRELRRPPVFSSSRV